MENIMEYKFTVENFEEEVLKSELPVLVDFYADYCAPCRMMAPVVAALAEEFEGKCKVGKCDVQQNMLIAQKYHITNIPAFMMFKNGQPVASFIGQMTEDDFRNQVEQALA